MNRRGFFHLFGAGVAGIAATQFTGQTVRVSTIFSPGDSVKLPQALPGSELMVINDTVNAMSVFPFGTDTIDKAAANSSVSQMGISHLIYTCVTLGQWHTEALS